MLAPWYRRWIGRLFLAIGALLVSLSLVAVWTSDIIGDTDRYVDTVSPVIEDPVVQHQLAERLTDEIVAAIRPDQLIASVVDELSSALAGRPLLSTGVQALVAPLSGAFRDFVLQRVEAVVSSPQFAQAWDAANRAAHATMVKALTGKDEGIVTNTEGTVSIDVAALAQVVVDDLVARGFELAGQIPLPEASFTIFQSEELAKAQDAFRLLDTTALVLPWLALLFLVGAVLLAADRRRAVAHAGLAIVAGALLLGIALVFGRSTYLSSWTDAGYNADVGATLFDSLVHFLRIANRAAIVLGLIIAAVALLTGPGRAATSVRRTITGANAKAAPFVNDDLAAWVGRNRRGILVGVGVLALLWFVALDHPTPGLVLLIAIVAGLAYVAVGVVGAAPEPELELELEPEPEPIPEVPAS